MALKIPKIDLEKTGFLKGTEVFSDYFIPIETLQQSKTLVLCLTADKPEAVIPDQIVSFRVNMFYDIVTEDCGLFRTACSQPFFTKRGILPANMLVKGDFVLSDYRTESKVVYIRLVKVTAPFLSIFVNNKPLLPIVKK